MLEVNIKATASLTKQHKQPITAFCMLTVDDKVCFYRGIEVTELVIICEKNTRKEEKEEIEMTKNIQLLCIHAFTIRLYKRQIAFSLKKRKNLRKKFSFFFFL